MKLNNRMSSLVQTLGVAWPPTEEATISKPLELEFVEDCVLLKGQYERNKHVTMESCFDKSGYESFINHVHLPFLETKESLIDCLSYATALQRALLPLAGSRRFRVMVAISDDCTVRFHEIRPGESPASDNIESYKSEAILVFDVDTPTSAD